MSQSINQLVPVTEQQIGADLVLAASARDLHEYLQVRRDFSNWIKGRIAKFGFTEGTDYASEDALSSPNRASAKGRQQRVLEYHLALDMAKELAMVENNAMGRQARRYFIECEKQLQAKRVSAVMVPAPSDPRWMGWLAQSSEERRTKWRDSSLYGKAWGPVAMRWAMVQQGYPIPPDQILGIQEQYELELLQRGVSVTVNVGGHAD